MEGIIPYLTFEGNASDALAFYTEVLGGSVLYSQTFRESQLAEGMPEAWKDKIMHGAFQSGDLQLMVSDTPDEVTKVSAGDQVQLALNFNSEKQIDQVFARLAEEGIVTMPLEKTFWGAKFAMVTDKFGIRWMLNYDYQNPDPASPDQPGLTGKEAFEK